MNNSSRSINQLFFSLLKISSLARLRVALKHNAREIDYELSAHAHINKAKRHLNYSLIPFSSNDELVKSVNEARLAYEKTVGKSMRCDAVVAIEILFSVSQRKTDINLRQYFEECLRWASAEFAPASAMTADVHLDEANPHMHCIFLCVTNTKLVASGVAGYKAKYRKRFESFYKQVAQKYGFEMPAPTLNRTSRIQLARVVIDHFDQANNPITQSDLYLPVCDAVRHNPAPFALALGIPIPHEPQKMSTVAEIFTSKGLGPRYRPNE